MDVVNQFQALEYLQAGKTVIFPTETSYGLGCDATNQTAVNKIFKIKNRRLDKPLLMVVSTIEMVKEYLEWTQLFQNLADKYWPGPLTVVGRLKFQNSIKSKILASGVVTQNGTVAVRVTNAEVPKYLSEKLGRPIVATSANIANAGDVYDSAELIKMYAGHESQPDIIITAGVLPSNLPSTIVSVIEGELKILRQGSLIINL